MDCHVWTGFAFLARTIVVVPEAEVRAVRVREIEMIAGPRLRFRVGSDAQERRLWLLNLLSAVFDAALSIICSEISLVPCDSRDTRIAGPSVLGSLLLFRVFLRADDSDEAGFEERLLAHPFVISATRYSSALGVVCRGAAFHDWLTDQRGMCHRSPPSA